MFLTSISPYVKNLPTELTESEKNNPFAKYYYEEMGAITEEHEAAIISAPLAPEDCYMPSETALHMNKEGEDGHVFSYIISDCLIRLITEYSSDPVLYKENAALP